VPASAELAPPVVPCARCAETNGPDIITLPAGESGIVTGIKGPTQQQCAVAANCYETLLDQLNDQGYPEPGMEGSPFTPLKLPSQLAPGQTYTIKVKN
jgi:hypothetical protein